MADAVGVLRERSTSEKARPGGAFGSGRRGRGRNRLFARQSRVAIAFTLPFVIIFALTMLAPIGYAIYTSLFTTKLIGGTVFSGFANYSQVLTTGEFWSGVERVAIFAVIQVPVTLFLAFFFASLFDLGVIRLGGFFRAVYFIPFAVPAVVAAIMWSFLLVPQYGVYTRLLGALGFSGANFFSGHLILATIILIVIWEVTGYNMVIFYAALKAVPREVVEAAIIDGASLRTIITRVKLPMVRPAVIMLCVLNLIGALQLFTEPSIVSSFEPESVSFGFTPMLYIYNTAIGDSEYNLAAAAAVVFALVIAAVSVGWLVTVKRKGTIR
jgi:multiple sugar transport system permease protein